MYLCLLLSTSIHALLLTHLALLVKFSADDILKYFSYLFPENRISYFMQIAPNGDDLDEMSNPVSFLRK